MSLIRDISKDVRSILILRSSRHSIYENEMTDDTGFIDATKAQLIKNIDSIVKELEIRIGQSVVLLCEEQDRIADQKQESQ